MRSVLCENRHCGLCRVADIRGSQCNKFIFFCEISPFLGTQNSHILYALKLCCGPLTSRFFAWKQTWTQLLEALRRVILRIELSHTSCQPLYLLVWKYLQLLTLATISLSDKHVTSELFNSTISLWPGMPNSDLTKYLTWLSKKFSKAMTVHCCMWPPFRLECRYSRWSPLQSISHSGGIHDVMTKRHRPRYRLKCQYSLWITRAINLMIMWNDTSFGDALWHACHCPRVSQHLWFSHPPLHSIRSIFKWNGEKFQSSTPACNLTVYVHAIASMPHPCTD